LLQTTVCCMYMGSFVLMESKYIYNIYIYIYIYIYIHAHTYMYMYVHAHTHTHSTPIYMAPECYASKFGETGCYGPAMDVYAFGITMWEILSRRTPFADIPFTSDLGVQVLEGLRPKISHRCPPEMRQLIEECWHRDPLQRPTAPQVARRLKDLFALYDDRNDGSMPIFGII
jgi:serine/threonine protein kinase